MIEKETLIGLDDDVLLEALQTKLVHYKQGYELIKDLTTKSSDLREEIEVIKGELETRFEKQKLEQEQEHGS